MGFLPNMTNLIQNMTNYTSFTKLNTSETMKSICFFENNNTMLGKN